MYDNQKLLRQAAQRVLTQRGYDVEVVKGSGGARLRAHKDGHEALVQVRTSSDRWIGWMRKGGEWKGFDEAALIVVAAIDNVQRPRNIEVYGFEPATVKAAFAQNLAARRKANPEFSQTAPVFIGLDPCLKGKPSSTASNLKADALWMASTPLDEADRAARTAVEPPSARTESREKFAARVRQEFAELVGAPIEKVSIELRVTI